MPTIKATDIRLHDTLNLPKSGRAKVTDVYTLDNGDVEFWYTFNELTGHGTITCYPTTEFERID